MSVIANVPVQCPVCGGMLSVPITAGVALPSDVPENVSVSITVDQERWIPRLNAHIASHE